MGLGFIKGSEGRCENKIIFFVGVPRLELGTSSLSVTRSNHLSYTPVLNQCGKQKYSKKWAKIQIFYNKKHRRLATVLVCTKALIEPIRMSLF